MLKDSKRLVKKIDDRRLFLRMTNLDFERPMIWYFLRLLILN